MFNELLKILVKGSKNIVSSVNMGNMPGVMAATAGGNDAQDAVNANQTPIDQTPAGEATINATPADASNAPESTVAADGTTSDNQANEALPTPAKEEASTANQVDETSEPVPMDTTPEQPISGGNSAVLSQPVVFNPFHELVEATEIPVPAISWSEAITNSVSKAASSELPPHDGQKPAELIREQDDAYMKAIQESKKMEEEARLKEQQALDKKTEKEKKIKEAGEQLSEEPSQEEDNIIVIRFHIPGKNSLVRRFRQNHSLHEVYLFLASLGYTSDEYRATTTPTEDLPDCEESFADKDISGKFILNVVRRLQKK